ncbi:MAG: serine hydrolase domain-containing protein, partial [Actinomyces massiliensis]
GAGTAHNAVGAGTASGSTRAMLPGATVRHLLAHASGIAFDSDAVLAAPGTRRIYSNRGIEILGERLQEATATPLERWVETTVLEPLGMSSVLVPGSPAHSGEGTARDLAVFAGELAAPRLISASLAAEATSVVFPGLDGVLPGYGRQAPNDFGLGVEVRGHKHPHWTGRAGSPTTFGHFGQSGSFIWVDPEARRQAVFLGERRFAAVHKDIWPDLCDQILALEAPDSAVNG